MNKNNLLYMIIITNENITYHIHYINLCLIFVIIIKNYKNIIIKIYK